jgi:hypothetical protein
MSLEQALADNTAALKALTAALADPVRLTLPAPQPTVAPVPPAFGPSLITSPEVVAAQAAMNAALSTAVAPPPPIAPVVPPVTSPEPTNVFAQAAATSVVPATPVAPPIAAPAPSGNVDAKGLPWDGRIHASSKARVADGSWRMKRGVDDALVATVTAGLRAALGAPAAPGAGALAAMPWPFATSAADVQPLPVPPPPPANAYASLMAQVSQRIAAGGITVQQVTDACVALGVPSVAELATREDLVPFVAQALGVTL